MSDLAELIFKANNFTSWTNSLFTLSKLLSSYLSYLEASCGAGAQNVTVKLTSCRFDPHSRKLNVYLHLYFHFFAVVSRQSAALSSATQHAMPPEFGRKWVTECLNTRLPLPILLCAEYSVKLIKIKNKLFLRIF